MSLVKSPRRDGVLGVLSPVSAPQMVDVTGPPGAGKSTTVGALVGTYREREMRVAVLTVDPSRAPILKLVAAQGEGIGELVEAIDDHHRADSPDRRKARARAQILSLAQTLLRNHPELDCLAEMVAGGRRDPIPLPSNCSSCLLNHDLPGT